MSDDPMLRRAFAKDRTDRTERTATDYYENRCRRRERARRLGVSLVPTIEEIVDVDNLLFSFKKLKTEGGPAPGPDDISYTDLGNREVAQIMRTVSRLVREGKYRPGPCREVPIPKLRGGFRILRISNVIDRVLAAALNEALQPLWESVFLPQSMGFRPERGVLTLLADLEAAVIQHNAWVIASDDIKGAFDNVVLKDVMEDHRKHIQDPKVLAFIETVLRGHNWERIKGIDQGCPYSPTGLNICLHYAHDAVITQNGGCYPLWFRYADNLLYLCQSVLEGEQVLNRVNNLLQGAQLTLKGQEGPPVDLRTGEEAHLLGFTLRKTGNRLTFNLGSDAWIKLEQDLLKAHEAVDPPATARAIVAGWIEAFGPAFESWRSDVAKRISKVEAKYGFRNLSSLEELRNLAESAWTRWQVYRKVPLTAGGGV